MNGQAQTYLCIREVGAEFQLQPAGRDLLDSVREGAGNAWYFITTRPLDEFVFLGSFGSYRDMQAAFSAMVLVDPSIQKADTNYLL